MASTAYDSGSTSLTASSTRAARSRGTNSPHSRICGSTISRHELDGLELGAREGADEQAEGRAEHGVGDRDDDEQPDRARRRRARAGRR